MPVQSAKRKTSFEERAAEMKAKNERQKRGIPARLATPELRRQRLIAIKERMQLAHPEFREMLGLSEQHWRSVYEGTKPVVMGIVMLAEIALKNFLRRERKKIPPLAAIPEEYVNNAELSAKVITAHILGKSNEEIAAEYSIRPDIVTYYLSKIQ